MLYGLYHDEAGVARLGIALLLGLPALAAFALWGAMLQRQQPRRTCTLLIRSPH